MPALVNKSEKRKSPLTSPLSPSTGPPSPIHRCRLLVPGMPPPPPSSSIHCQGARPAWIHPWGARSAQIQLGRPRSTIEACRRHGSTARELKHRRHNCIQLKGGRGAAVGWWIFCLSLVPMRRPPRSHREARLALIEDSTAMSCTARGREEREGMGLV